MKHIQNTQAAEEARSAKQKGENRRHVQKEGALYASDVLQMVKQRNEAEMAKAEMAEKTRKHASHKILLTQKKASVRKRCSNHAY